MATQTSFINSLLDAAFRGQTYTGGVIKMGLFKTGLPSSTGVEVSGGSYARQTLTFSVASAKTITTSAEAVFPNLPTGAANTVVAYGIYNGTTLIDEGTLSTPFTPDLSSNEFRTNYTFDLTGA